MSLTETEFAAQCDVSGEASVANREALSEPELAAIGARLRELRDARGASAVTVAQEALGYQNGYHAAVTRLERGILKMPSAHHIEKLAAYYGVAVSEILPEGLTLADLVQPPAPVSTPVDSLSEKVIKATKAPSGKDFAGRLMSVRASMELEPWEFSALVRRNGALVTQADIERWEAREATPNPVQMAALDRTANQGEGWLEHGKAVPVKAAVSGWAAFGVARRDT